MVTRILTATLISLCFIACSKKYNKSNDTVIVIGAGIAGLAAAQELTSKGVEHVIILEAQNKAGGRLSTNRSLGIPFDEGASWIHGPDGNPITKLAVSAGMETFFTDDDNLIVYDMDGSTYSDTYLDQTETEFEEALEAIEIAGTKDNSFESVFKSLYPQFINNRFWKYLLSSWIEFDTGGDMAKMTSSDFYDDDNYPGADVIVTNGYDKISDYLAKDLVVNFNQEVVKVDYSKDKKILVTTSTESFEAKAIVCTVPLGVLKKGDINFSPSLPASKISAMNQLDMGSINKFLLVWDSVFWDLDEQYIGYTPETKGKFNYFLNVSKFMSANALMTFAFGDYGKTTEAMSDAEVTEAIMEHLKVMYGASIPEPINMLRTKWSSNKYSYGSYSYILNGGSSDAYEVMAESIDDRIFFAGEHTSFDYRGTVHGAYNSGIDAATELLDRFKE